MFERRKLLKFSRKWHRILGLVIGIQFFFWTFGGFYFAWFHIDNVRGKYEKTQHKAPNLKKLRKAVSIESILQKSTLPSVKEIRVGMLEKTPVIRLYKNRSLVETYRASDGQKLSPIGKKTAMRIAKADFSPKDPIEKVTLVSKKQGEYKGPIPAYRVDFSNSKSTHIYVHVHTGLVTARRNSIWRGFDFLWMLHILDFQNRSNFNNWLLRILSLLGLLTLLSGYVLWALTTPLFRPKKNTSKNPSPTPNAPTTQT